MGVNFDRWTLLKLFEVAAVVACLICKRVTDDEAGRLFLYLQKLSREWSLLNNVTWDRIGAAVADATYGGYVIIAAALFLGRLIGELPTTTRVTEYILLGVGALLFIILGSLEFASLDSVPYDLVDNAAVIGTLSLVTAALFLLDMGGPKAKKAEDQTSPRPTTASKPLQSDPKSVTQQVYEMEKAIEKSEKTHLDEGAPKASKNGHVRGLSSDPDGRYRDSIYKKIMEDHSKPKSFGIYGKDAVDGNSETDDAEELPPKMQEHSPVWSKIRKGHYGRLDEVSPAFLYPKDQSGPERPPSGPGDPGYVQYTAQHWGEPGQKTPRQSPTQV